MAKLDTAVATSRRGYLSKAELAQFADITITDTGEADDQIAQSEEIIDNYVGPHDRFFKQILNGKATAGGATSLTLQTNHQNVYEIDYFKGMQLEILGGSGVGDIIIISASTKAGVLTTEAFSTATDNTSIYRIFQLGKFPRIKDVYYDSESGDDKYYKNIPEKVRRAVAAQVQYMIKMGADFFATDGANLKREKIGDYEYEKGQGGSTGSINNLIAPKAKMFLRGIKNIKGVIEV